MRLKLFELKELVRETILEAHSSSVVNLFYGKDESYILDPRQGQKLEKDINNWKYDDFLKFFKEKGVYYVNVQAEHPTIPTPVKPGEYSNRKFLSKLIVR